jgi:hypothetical protein
MACAMPPDPVKARSLSDLSAAERVVVETMRSGVSYYHETDFEALRGDWTRARAERDRLRAEVVALRELYTEENNERAKAQTENDRLGRLMGLYEADAARFGKKSETLAEAIDLMLCEIEGIEVGYENGCKATAIEVGQKALGLPLTSDEEDHSCE